MPLFRACVGTAANRPNLVRQASSPRLTPDRHNSKDHGQSIGAGLILRSLRARLLIIVAVSILPALSFQVYSESEAHYLRERQLNDEALRLVRLIGFEEAETVERGRDALDLIGADLAGQRPRPEDCRNRLAILLHDSPRYASASIIGADGRIVCASAAIDPDADMSRSAGFRRALDTGGLVIGDYAVADGSTKPAIHLAEPFRDRGGMVLGVVDIALDVDWLREQLDRLALPAGATAWITDRNGTILARTPDGPNFVGKPLPAEDRLDPKEGDARVVARVRTDGHPIIVAGLTSGTDAKRLYVGVGLDSEMIATPSPRVNETGLLLLILGFWLAMGATALLSTRLVRTPLRRLLDIVDRWRMGDAGARSGLRDDGTEIGLLAVWDGWERAYAGSLRSSFPARR
jgi:hypothetical protein